MTIKSSQISLADVFKDCQNIFDSDKPSFINLLESYIDFNEFIPNTFYEAYYQKLGRNREYPLNAFISSFILQKIISIPTDSLLIIILHLSKELREFCGFTKIPDSSKFTRFKQDFLPFIEQMFLQLVDFTEPICQAIDSSLASTIAFDTTGIELYVTENNPKTLNSLIKRLKSYYKNNSDIDPYKMAYGLMPSSAAKSKDAKQMYINGHFCYASKVTIVTNGLGIIRHISFLDDDFINSHTELIVEKKTDSPDEDKSIGDASALKPVLNDFMNLHPNFNMKTFLGDSAFDSIELYSFLKDQCHFSKVLIPYNTRNKSTLKKVGFNEYGYPLCPNDESLQMKRLGISREKGRSDRIKWGCPKVRMVNKSYVCDCDDPCSTAKKGRTTYTYENLDFRMYPGIQRDSPEWLKLYKVRGVVEQTINHFKINMCIAGRKSRNLQTTKADAYFAGIASLFTLVIASRINKYKYIRSLKPLIA